MKRLNVYSMPKLKKTLSFLVISLIAVAQFTAFAPKAQACSCAEPDPDPQKMVQEAWTEYDAIFSGTITSLQIGGSSSFGDEIQVSITPIDVWKGGLEKNNKTSIRTQEYGDTCGYEFEVGELYIVYALKNSETGYLTINSCSPTKKLANAS